MKKPLIAEATRGYHDESVAGFESIRVEKHPAAHVPKRPGAQRAREVRRALFARGQLARLFGWLSGGFGADRLGLLLDFLGVRREAIRLGSQL